MRTNIEIDDELLAQVMRSNGAKTKREAVHRSLQTELRLIQQRDAIRSLRGTGWDGDLGKLRLSREFEPVI